MLRGLIFRYEFFIFAHLYTLFTRVSFRTLLTRALSLSLFYLYLVMDNITCIESKDILVSATVDW